MLAHLQGDSPEANQGRSGKMRLRLILPQNFLKLLLGGQRITPVFSQIAGEQEGLVATGISWVTITHFVGQEFCLLQIGDGLVIVSPQASDIGQTIADKHHHGVL